jgi:predicted nucleic acid-binding protein
MLVGATALAQGYALATLRQREFQRIPGLVLVGVERFAGSGGPGP